MTLDSAESLRRRPQLVEKTAFLQSVEVTPIDEILRLYFFGTRIDFRALIDDCLKRFGLEFQPDGGRPAGRPYIQWRKQRQRTVVALISFRIMIYRNIVISKRRG